MMHLNDKEIKLLRMEKRYRIEKVLAILMFIIYIYAVFSAKYFAFVNQPNPVEVKITSLIILLAYYEAQEKLSQIKTIKRLRDCIRQQQGIEVREPGKSQR